MENYAGFLIVFATIISMLTAYQISRVLMNRWNMHYNQYNAPFNQHYWFGYANAVVTCIVIYNLSHAMLTLLGPIAAVAAVVAGPVLTVFVFIYVVGMLKIFERMICGMQKLQ